MLVGLHVPTNLTNFQIYQQNFEKATLVFMGKNVVPSKISFRNAF